MQKQLFSYTKELYTPSILKWLYGLFAWVEIWGSKSNIFVSNFLYQKDFWHRNFWGCFGVVDVFYFESHTYNFSNNGQRALILPKLETRTIILKRKIKKIIVEKSLNIVRVWG